MPILENLGESGLARRHRGTETASKVIIEKPFGRDLASAQQLNQVINRRFDESQVFRIDHYLGKETVQSLLVQRFANSIFEPVWNRNYVSSVQITVSEDLGVGTRGGYYDKSGALERHDPKSCYAIACLNRDGTSVFLWIQNLFAMRRLKPSRH